jgi:hypothetical protein
MKTSQLLQAAACVEILSQELHAELSATVADSPTLRDRFLRLAEEEGQHAKCLQLLDRHRVKVPLTAEVSERISWARGRWISGAGPIAGGPARWSRRATRPDGLPPSVRDR